MHAVGREGVRIGFCPAGQAAPVHRSHPPAANQRSARLSLERQGRENTHTHTNVHIPIQR